MSYDIFFEPSPESPVGMAFEFEDPDTLEPIMAIVATDGFRVEVTGEYETLPGVAFFVPSEERVVFGFLAGVANIVADSVNGGILAEEIVFPTMISRYEAPLSVVEYVEELERALNAGRFIVTYGINDA